ncbi:MAG: thymidine phosphorylase [Opitutaceae bacterium]
MFPQHIIAKKRDGRTLARVEIEAFVRGATDGSWADYQLSALLMAIFLRGMDATEMAHYTDAMIRSGTVADLSHVPGIKVDKHSTGGVGDKVSLVLAPMVAACGVPVPMISGRSLGHSGGTLDKLESIPGFRTSLSLEEFGAQVARIGCALIGQTDDLAPADRKLYALRDVTATVECIPLICGSILSKKLAEGIDALVLDVKFGRGAFMKTRSDARQLAGALVQIGQAAGKKVAALLTSMEQPLGRTVGNALEVAEAIACLRGQGPQDVMDVTNALGAQMLLFGGVATSEVDARGRLERVVANGGAIAKFREILAAQDGDVRVTEDPLRLPRATHTATVRTNRAGVVGEVDALQVAHAALRLGAGRARAEDAVDPAVGIAELVKIGEHVGAGATLCVIHANDTKALGEVRASLEKAIVVGSGSVHAPELVGEII